MAKRQSLHILRQQGIMDLRRPVRICMFSVGNECIEGNRLVYVWRVPAGKCLKRMKLKSGQTLQNGSKRDTRDLRSINTNCVNCFQITDVILKHRITCFCFNTTAKYLESHRTAVSITFHFHGEAHVGSINLTPACRQKGPCTAN